MKKVLIVDDDDDDVILACRAVSDMAIQITQAADTRTALAAIKNQKPDFVLIDFNFVDSLRIILACAMHDVPAIFWSSLPVHPPHRMFISKELLLTGEGGFQNHLLDLIDKSHQKGRLS